MNPRCQSFFADLRHPHFISFTLPRPPQWSSPTSTGGLNQRDVSPCTEIMAKRFLEFGILRFTPSSYKSIPELHGGDVELVGVDDVRVAVDNGEAAKVAYVIFLHSRFVVFNILLFPVPQPDQFDLRGDGKRKRVQQTYDLRASHRTGSRMPALAKRN